MDMLAHRNHRTAWAVTGLVATIVVSGLAGWRQDKVSRPPTTPVRQCPVAAATVPAPAKPVVPDLVVEELDFHSTCLDALNGDCAIVGGVCTDRSSAIYTTVDGGASWSRIAADLPRSSVLAVHWGISGDLWAVLSIDDQHVVVLHRTVSDDAWSRTELPTDLIGSGLPLAATVLAPSGVQACVGLTLSDRPEGILWISTSDAGQSWQRDSFRLGSLDLNEATSVLTPSDWSWRICDRRIWRRNPQAEVWIPTSAQPGEAPHPNKNNDEEWKEIGTFAALLPQPSEQI